MPVGLVIGSGMPPEHLGSVASQAEQAGFDEVWVSEDFFFSGGIAGAAIALAATHHIRVGLGVVSAMVRHPAQLAMELATLARVYPGRLMPGIGLGVPAWMDQMGLMPASPVSAVRECVTMVRALLEGETVTCDGQVYSLRDGALTHAPAERLPIVLGVVGPRLLRLSGALADGSVLSVLAGEEYLRFARAEIDAGRAAAQRTDDHRITAFAIYSTSHDRAEARQAARDALAFYASAGGPNALTDAAGISDQLREWLAAGVDLRDAMPEEWVDRLTIAGDPAEVAERVRALGRAGADAVALFPVPADRAQDLLQLSAREVLPRL
jgi:alkanesulfonate monooxygenase SsuD/methylene tetrahydromethanopterin reductase-like flavin-dependent oxidoreductase (luciferase family)